VIDDDYQIAPFSRYSTVSFYPDFVGDLNLQRRSLKRQIEIMRRSPLR
jgi:hypothetical protein